VSEGSTLGPPVGTDGWARAMAQHEGLVRWVVRQQWRGDLPCADALHAGRLGLWQALRHYDPTRGTQFSTYAVPAIRHAVWAAVALEQRPAPAGGPCPPPESAAPDPADLVEQATVHTAVRALVGQLPPRLQQVVVAHYGLAVPPPQSFAALGRRWGVSRQRVHQLHRAALLALAHPTRSLPLRRLVDHHGRSDYQQALAQQRQAARARRAPGRRRP
jgi:RNA polymerase sigma factor (sigma-70 family)